MEIEGSRTGKESDVTSLERDTMAKMILHMASSHLAFLLESPPKHLYVYI
jgi:hypothetical protein